MTHYNEVTQIPGVNDHLHVINLLVKVGNLYGAVFVSDGTDAFEFFKYSIVLIDEKDNSVKVDINLIGTRTTKDEPFSYEFSFSDSNIFVDSQVRIAHTVFEPIFKLYISFNEPDINEFIKLSKKLISKFLKLDNHWQITSIPEIILQNYYLHYYNSHQHINESIDYFQPRYEIIFAFNYKKKRIVFE